MTGDRTVMILDGDYSHTLAIAGELKRSLGVRTVVVSSRHNSPGALSRHTDISELAPSPLDIQFPERLLELVTSHRPDIVLPVGHASFAATLSVTGKLPDATSALVPSMTSFSLATDKSATYELADQLGIRAPMELPMPIDTSRWRSDSFDFPIFVKSRHEQGGVSTALIGSEAELAAFDPVSLGGDVIFQEFISGPPHTYAHCGYFENGRPIVSFQHLELRSVPRRGGSGTRVRVVDEPEVAALGNQLLQELEWDGVAQVEFKRSSQGQFVLMEINPKFWASYALAPASGHFIAATAVARAIGIQRDPVRGKSPRVGTTMVFPVREFWHTFKHRKSESVLASLASMLWPPARPDFELLDLRAHVPRRLPR